MTLVPPIRRLRLALPLLALATGGCLDGERGLETAHQPIVGPHGATVPDCPDWSDAYRIAREVQGSNYGCATKSNLAAMIADPQDLLHGRSDMADATTAAKAVKAWRETPPTGRGGIEKTGSKGN